MTGRIAFAVDHLDAARRFRVRALGCTVAGRTDVPIDVPARAHRPPAGTEPARGCLSVPERARRALP